MLRPLLALNLYADFRPVAEGEHQPVEQLLAEIHRQLLRFAKPRKEAAEKVVLDFPPLLFLLQTVHPAL